MPEARGRKHHFERLSEALKEEISAILEGELADPRIGLAIVTEVHLAPDGRSAHIFIAVEGGEEDAAATREGLEAAKGFIRHEIAERLRLRRPPEIFFELDRAPQYGARIEELLRRTRKR